jgi:hypothetical protein
MAKIYPNLDIILEASQDLESVMNYLGFSSPEDLINTCISSEPIGSGKMATVYEIPGYESLVLRIDTKIIQYLSTTLNEFIPNSWENFTYNNPFPDENVGQQIFTNSSQNISLSIRQSGDRVEELLGNDKEAYLIAIKNLKELPFESYLKLAKQLKMVNDAGYYWHGGSDDLIFDQSNDSFGLVDLTKGEGKDTCFEMMQAIADPAKAQYLLGEEIVEDLNIIFLNIYNAAVATDLVHPSKEDTKDTKFYECLNKVCNIPEQLTETFYL